MSGLADLMVETVEDDGIDPRRGFHIVTEG
jgi:hypothetical protein